MPTEAGPSSGLVRCPCPRATDISEIYAQLREMDNLNRMRLDEVKQEVDCLDSNTVTINRRFDEQLTAVKDITQQALERTTGIQDQVDQLHKQTSDMHGSLSAIHNHSFELMKSLGKMMERFEQLSFELPNMMDQWGRTQNGNGTVSGSQLQQSGWEMAFAKTRNPPPLPMLPTAPDSQGAGS